MIKKIEKVDFYRDQFAEACNRELGLRDTVKWQFVDWRKSLNPFLGNLSMVAVGIFLNLIAFYPLNMGFTEETARDLLFFAGYGACMIAAVSPMTVRSLVAMLRELSLLFRIVSLYLKARNNTHIARLVCRNARIGGENE
jgi:hypothetical protein